MSIPEPEVLPEDSVGLLLDTTLETINSIFEQAAVELPTRQYIYVGDQGETAHDCEQVTVSLAQLYPGTPGDEQQEPARCGSSITAVIIAEIVRAVPEGMPNRTGKFTAPTPEALSTTARVQAKDSWLLLQSGLTVGDEMHYLGSVVNVVAGPPSGGMQATVLTLVVAVP